MKLSGYESKKSNGQAIAWAYIPPEVIMNEQIKF